MPGLDDPALDRLWDVTAERLQRNGLSPRGRVTLDGLTRDERFALTGLVGRKVGDRARVDLAALDERIREAGAAPGLVAAVSARRGPLVDRPGLRESAAASRNAVWAAARATLATHGLDSEPWADAWLQSIRPLLGRLPPARAETVVTAAIRGITRLPWDGPVRGRTELAFAAGGSSHALDDGSILGAAVLRAVALMLGLELPTTSAGRRQLWARAGVLSDEVSTTVLTLGLQPAGDGVVDRTVRHRSRAGCETHLTRRDLRRIGRLVEPGTLVSACENPRVLEAAMDAGARGVIVCIAGNPTLVVTDLLNRLMAEGASLRYHGDFDWPGLAIANRVVGTSGARPWRMDSADYESAVSDALAEGVDPAPLEGTPVNAVWDTGLTAAMSRAGVAIHEESLLDVLVHDLL